ncbi:probable N-acetyltransferase HLS1-like [Typha angustifolia]|uniref:probable N-acetyltransferase HLS1-like n=1 Tax=Typha angustifolia TaxID=59011 RepID=UPI003C2AB335
MKCVGTGLEAGNVWIGCILGLRVSSKHRRIGIGLKLTESVEAWAVQNGAQHILLATDENNIASINLFVLKCHYMKLSSLAILVQPIDAHAKKTISNGVKIEKLSINQAVLIYKDRLGDEKFFPADIDAILNEQHSLGTWVSYFKEEEWNKDGEFLSSAPSSWAIVSMWKTYESYKLQLRCTPSVRCFYATLKQIGHNVLPCLRLPLACQLPRRPFGFLFLYGIHGEGERLSDLLKSLWYFAFSSARDVKDCKAIVSEVNYSDPLFAHMPSTSCIKDLWFMKRVGGAAMRDDKDLHTMKPRMHNFVDPRDF